MGKRRDPIKVRSPVRAAHREPVPLTQAEKDAVIQRAGQRTIEFYLERNRRGRMVCTGARIPA